MNELANNVEETNQKVQEDILAELAALSVVLIDVLNANAKSESITAVNANGTERTLKRTTVNTTKLRFIMSEIDRLEREYQSVLYDGLTAAMKEVAALTAESIVNELEDASKPFIANVEKELSKTVIIGDKTLEQRTKIAASDINTEIRKLVRQGVLGGDDVNTIISNVRNTFKDTDWTTRRIIESEIYNTYRYQFGKTTANNGYDWIRIHESFPRHPRRKMHKCYELANKDKYGKGAGVYKSTDAIIYFPHPQCTSWLEVVEVSD
ncbi:hypothetical protein [Macrococcus capreoli]|uniref:hypothetical protein n=1 Tax=Macrococcus capreoli TaxID=2982690 RepID=UPI0021D5A208|nr:hypothetical protein [Macrococcus sp. TMW 2.2395]MCU7556536.1 hypothetical protein [Macrococcus sp. TMW 2.2395]